MQPRFNHMPVILDEVLESPEAVTLRYEESYEGGLLACSDLADLLPMSTYGKSQSLDFNGRFDSSCVLLHKSNVFLISNRI